MQFSNCPICGNALYNEYYDYDKHEYLKQVCNKNISHNLLVLYKNNEINILSYLDRSDAKKILLVKWYYLIKEISVNGDLYGTIPWFEPTLKNRKELSNKIRNYMVLY